MSDKKNDILDDLNFDDDHLDGLLEDKAQPAKAAAELSLLRNIPVKLTLEVDSVEISLGELLGLGSGEVLPLDKSAGAPLDVRVNGTLLAKAEVVVVDGKYGLRLTEVLDELSLKQLSSGS
ncbi:flagellar motor switch protein FliN [Gallaecimonas pentaromativorans]|uniref:Flagellar motor switch protein FliN n=1 Tax=Gallaecimonas pentaromativorans TaxID=584787 RepID=A0A3N1P174_9GAMM|nr:flagellar motor switch protein FliN [Gallaecimonas pentaromativorans]MED5526516.1 flagellar motor switch protein FliN [Pseudomonadota bacterium]ROQ25854.1 flagellar motor switch protein FliN/FliY [Gallaecimonas pentaromativorans]